MPGFVLKNAVLEINATTGLQGFTRKVDLNYEFEEKDTTPFSTSTGGTGKTSIAGLGNWSATCTLLQDFNSGNVDSIVWPLVGASDFDVRIAVSSTGVSTAFPQWTGHGTIFKYNPVTGAPGDLLEVPLDIKGQGLLVRNAVTSCSGW